MTTNPTPERPMFRVTFSRITGKDLEGNDVLSRPKEIGAVWARKGNNLNMLLSGYIATEMNGEWFETEGGAKQIGKWPRRRLSP